MTAADGEIDLNRTPFAARPAWALIIGCGDLGMSTARALGRRHPLMIVDINSEVLDKAVGALDHEGYTVTGHVCDITNPEQLQELGQLLDKGSGIKVWAHVAALGKADFQAIIEVNLRAVHRVAEIVGPHILPGGVAVLISSVGGYRCPVGAEFDALVDDPFTADFAPRAVNAYGHEPDFLEAYFLTKLGVNRFAQRLALEWGPRQIRVVSVSPGLIDSTMGRTSGGMMPVWDGGDPSRRVTRDEKAMIETPLRRQAVIPEVTAVVDFLASDAASFVSGIDVPVDGGALVFWRKCGEADR